MSFDFWVSFLVLNLATPCVGHEPKARVAIVLMMKGDKNCQKKCHLLILKLQIHVFIVDANFMFIFPTFFLMAILKTYSFIVLRVIEK
jgi:hypothetical protein